MKQDYGQVNVAFGSTIRMFGIGFLLLLVLLLSSGAYHIVPPGHRGIAITLGKVDENFRPEGMTWKMPFITTIVDMPVQQITTGGRAECYSSDLQQVDIAFKVLYRIPEKSVVTLFQQYRGNPYENLIEPRIQESLKQVSAKHRAESLVQNRDQLKTSSMSLVKTSVSDLLVFSDLVIANIDFSDKLEKAIEEKVVKEQEALAKNFDLEKARKEAEITIVNANAEAESVRVKGEALKSAPAVVDLEIVKKWDGRTPSTVVVGSGGANVLLPIHDSVPKTQK